MNKINELLQQLDSIARSIDKYEMGLPIDIPEGAGYPHVGAGKEGTQKLQDAVKQFLVTELAEFVKWAANGYINGADVEEYIKQKGYESNNND